MAGSTGTACTGGSACTASDGTTATRLAGIDGVIDTDVLGTHHGQLHFKAQQVVGDATTLLRHLGEIGSCGTMRVATISTVATVDTLIGRPFASVG